MTCADAFTRTSDASWKRCFELFDDEPIIRRFAGRVRAVPILQDDPPKSLRLQRVAPGAKALRHEGCEPDVRARREDALEVAAALEERHREERLTVDLEEIEGREDLPASELAGVRVAGVVDLEIALVLPVVDEDAVDDRGLAARVRDDGVVELARPLERTGVPEE